MNELEIYFDAQEKLPSKSSLSAYRSQFKKIKKDIKYEEEPIKYLCDAKT